ncbi:MAG: polysaccharide deacetylase family protein [Verrucomicrobia bacterium]|nr:polysaccharide deacetylase family protein [Prolixibacteraceae bacterium]
MKSATIKLLISSLSRIVPIEKLSPFNNHRFVLPFWHAVSDQPLPHLAQLYRAPTTKEFERDLDFLLKNYKPAHMDDLVKLSANRGRSRKKLFFPTFDDGLASCYHVIAPILRRKGIPAAFFINPSFVDNRDLFHRHKASLILHTIKEKKSTPAELKQSTKLLQNRFNNNNLTQFLHNTVYTDNWLLDQTARIFDVNFGHFLANEKPYMSLEQIRELESDGFLIGAHGMDHREFFLCSEDEIMEQISSSMDYITRELNPPLRAFAFPYTDFNVSDAVFERARKDELWDLSFGTAGIKDETMPRHLQRIPMESQENAPGKKIIRTEYLWYYLKSIFGKNKVSRQ